MSSSSTKKRADLRYRGSARSERAAERSVGGTRPLARRATAHINGVRRSSRSFRLRIISGKRWEGCPVRGLLFGARCPSPHHQGNWAPVHEGFATHGVNPVIRVDPKLPLSVEPARAAVSCELRGWPELLMIRQSAPRPQALSSANLCGSNAPGTSIEPRRARRTRRTRRTAEPPREHPERIPLASL